MSELLNQLWTPELQAAFTVVVVLLVILYVLSIVWVVRDAYPARFLLVRVGYRGARPVARHHRVTACCARRCCRSTATSRSWRSR